MEDVLLINSGTQAISERKRAQVLLLVDCTGCPTRYQTRHFFNNSNTNKDIVTKFKQQYVIFFHISYTMR
jgi:hypothetical protein